MSNTPLLNREMGWLRFNRRVLSLAADPRNPVLERIKFLNIYQSNLDEFFMKRVGGLKRQLLSKIVALSADGLSTEEQLKLIRDKVVPQQDEIHQLLTQDLLPTLQRDNISLLNWIELTEAEQKWATEFFTQKVFPVLTPMAVDLGHPFPLISNLSVSLAVSLKLPQEEELLFARIKIPQVFPTWLQLPNTENKSYRFVSLVEVVKQNLSALFPKMSVMNVSSFRVTRNVDVESDEEGVEDLLEMIEEELKQRRFAEAVRLETEPNADAWLLEFLMDELDLKPEDVYESPLPLEYKDLSAIANLPIPNLKFKPWVGLTLPPLLGEENNIFNIIKANDILVHHPYESFSTSVERFIITAADDPNVVAIKMTMYRTGEDSSIVHALMRAAEKGKQVVCLVELKARFDEERNIYWAQALERAGVHVVYGIVGLKTHAKLAMVVRREKDDFKTYVHIGTGNYHPQTAKVYTDLGLFTAKPEITNEVIEVFHYLTGRSLKTDYEKLLVSPINLKRNFLLMIENEINNAKAGKKARIIAKCNNLEDKDIIEALYQASQAGVQIDLIIRGFSCLKPQTPGLSENIRIISVLGPFLEHSRVFYFQNGAESELDGLFFIGSADWMTRNLIGRVEVVTPIMDRPLKEKLWEILSTMLSDQRLAWEMLDDGSYNLRTPQNPEVEVGTHDALMEKTKSKAVIAARPIA